MAQRLCAQKEQELRTLNFDDILNYQEIIVALTETDRLVKGIDKIRYWIKEKTNIVLLKLLFQIVA